MFKTYPRLFGRENKMVLSREELMIRLNEWIEARKSCEVGLYSFSEWLNNEPIRESVLIDVVMFHGPEEKLRELGKKFHGEGFDGYLIDDGKEIFLLVECEIPLTTQLQEYPEVTIEQNIMKKIVFPGCWNLRTEKKSHILERWE